MSLQCVGQLDCGSQFVMTLWEENITLIFLYFKFVLSVF